MAGLIIKAIEIKFPVTIVVFLTVLNSNNKYKSNSNISKLMTDIT